MSFEGAGRTYRYARDDVRTLSYHFGDGLTYTEFSYSNPVLCVDGLSAVSARVCQNVSVSVTVTNTGRRPGSEVVQLYLAGENATATPPDHIAPAHVRALAGFARTRMLAVGESEVVELAVPHTAMSVVVVAKPSGALAPGTLAKTTRMLSAPRRFVLSVGGSQPRPAGVEWSSAAATIAGAALKMPGFNGSTVLGLELALAGTSVPLAQCRHP